VFLDEPINKEVIEFIDYVDDGNVLQFRYLNDWASLYNQYPQQFGL